VVSESFEFAIDVLGQPALLPRALQTVAERRLVKPVIRPGGLK